MSDLLRGFALISALLAAAAPIAYAYVNQQLLTGILLNPVYYISLLLSVLFFCELRKPYLQRRHLCINVLGVTACIMINYWIGDEEISANSIGLVFNLCAYFNELLGCLGVEEEEY